MKSRLSLLAALSVLSLSSLAWAPRAEEEHAMKPGFRMERELKAKESHTYTIELQLGQLLNAVAQQKGVDVVVEVFDPSGASIAQIDSPNGAQGPEAVTVFASTAGVYKLVVKGLEEADAGKYEMRIESILNAAEYAEKTAKESYGEGILFTLWKDYSEKGRPAIDALLAERKGKGPIVEQDPSNPDACNVTFLFTAPSDTTRVVMFGGPDQANQGTEMKRFEDSNLWVATVTMPADSRFTYRYMVSRLSTLKAPGSPPITERKQSLASDPLTSFTFGGASALELPKAPPQPWIKPDTTKPRGRVEMKTLKSEIMGEERRIGVYTPPNFDPKGQKYSVMVVFDGEVYGTSLVPLVPTPIILNNLINAGKIPPVVALLVNGQGQRNRDLTCNPKFADFLAKELMPWAQANYNVSNDPAKAITAGSSFGGICATYSALRHPQVFGNVLSQSGSYWFGPNWQGLPNRPTSPETGWLIKQFVESPKLPLKFYMDVGAFEGAAQMVGPNRHLRDVLRLKGYTVDYREFNGGHDYFVWRGTLADGLISLIGK